MLDNMSSPLYKSVTNGRTFFKLLKCSTHQGYVQNPLLCRLKVNVTHEGQIDSENVLKF